MAKTATAKVESTDLVQIDEELEQELRADVGKGVSTQAADNLVPLIYVLQPLSPQVLDGPARIEGAKPGDIWLKNADNPIISGKEGMWYMPCKMYQKWVEWVPRERGGGIVASYDYNGGEPPEGAERDKNVKNRPRFWFPQTGNECVDTRYEAGIAWDDGNPMPFVIPFKSTGHAISRGWMTKRVNQRRSDGTIWPSWSHVYKLTTVKRTNTSGTWYVFEVGPPQLYIPGYKNSSKAALDIVGGDYRTAYRMGKALEAAFETGQKIHEEEDFSTGAPDAGAGPREDMDDNVPY